MALICENDVSGMLEDPRCWRHKCHETSTRGRCRQGVLVVYAAKLEKQNHLSLLTSDTELYDLYCPAAFQRYVGNYFFTIH